MKARTPLYIQILLTFGLVWFAFEMFAPDSGYFSNILFWLSQIIGLLVTLIVKSVGDLTEIKYFKSLSEEDKKAYVALQKMPFFKRLWDSAVKKQSVKEENAIIIDHGFDGITELDNSLPKWWLGLFYFGCIYCVIYMFAYAFSDFAHQEKEYTKEYTSQLASIEEYEKTAPKITLETAKYSAEDAKEGEELFKSNCVSCHGDGGKGGIGPNLTDQNWINHEEKSVFKNVYWMLENGSPNNPAMRAFIKDGTISPRDAEKISSYVYHINQEVAPITVKEGGAAPQGDPVKWEE
ncbi:cbb3-type cytochrome c oxidase N-terminal domain-containing protein [Elizabethkingia sp. JS20170427COW]|uniref:cbb3-type cytochrome c oxidase N-terminal domain-containing protein n=1 Tax=Elizabethkingia sp. JS20170427COW TaxID=2583851 RepID=UPI00111087BC|nr:cbb3-type cytochrome c oxidase N-terminal domain-containing protein [Elizabethkingia sp. JS20170427COW]QCX53688.1 c-type cytochrome [Elizabethkingia sp. JS20170427COW]